VNIDACMQIINHECLIPESINDSLGKSEIISEKHRTIKPLGISCDPLLLFGKQALRGKFSFFSILSGLLSFVL